jgi:hypothetical protein
MKDEPLIMWLKLKMVYKPDHHEDQDQLEEEQG